MSKKDQVSQEELEQQDTDEPTNEAAKSDEKQEINSEDALKVELAEMKNKYTRLYAEFENFRKRTSKERIEILKNAGKDVILDLLPLMDDFDRALIANENSDDTSAVIEGFTLIQQKFQKTLEAKGVKPMDSIGKTFDVEFHEAITNIPAPSEDMKGKVVDAIEKGYYLNDQVLRYAKVVVGQ